MARLIQASEGVTDVVTGTSFFGTFYIQCLKGWSGTKYNISDIKRIEAVDEEQFRSGGKAAAGAIIGGVLTGGIGLLAGAAMGGRRRKNITVFIEFNDGTFAAFEEKKKAFVKILADAIQKRTIDDMTSS